METHSSILALENPMDRGALQATVHSVTESNAIEATEPGMEGKLKTICIASSYLFS